MFTKKFLFTPWHGGRIWYFTVSFPSNHRRFLRQSKDLLTEFLATWMHKRVKADKEVIRLIWFRFLMQLFIVSSRMTVEASWIIKQARLSLNYSGISPYSLNIGLLNSCFSERSLFSHRRVCLFSDCWFIIIKAKPFHMFIHKGQLRYMTAVTYHPTPAARPGCIMGWFRRADRSKGALPCQF